MSPLPPSHIHLWPLNFWLSGIHPSYKLNKIPPSCSPTIYRPQFEKPPRRYWYLWHHFLCFHVEPYITSHTLTRDMPVTMRHEITFFKHRHYFHLYHLSDNELVEFHLAWRNWHQSTILYHNVPYVSTISPDDPNLILVDVYYTNHGMATCGIIRHNFTTPTLDDSVSNLPTFYSKLPSTLQQICSIVYFPSDDGVQLISKCWHNHNNIFGASDASFHHGQTTHAWVISPGEVSDLEMPNMTISGSWAVDGYSPHMSSGRGSCMELLHYP